MSTPHILTATIASLLFASAAFGVTDTWDGNLPNAGAGDSNVSTGLNWADDTAPLSDLVNTDLVFAGLTKLAPVFTVALSTDSVVFNNTAGAFTLGGAQLNVGATGLLNNDTQTQTITNLVNFGGVANSTITAASGQLVFTNTVTLPTAGLAVNGASTTSFANLTGTAVVTKSGTGTLVLAPTTTVSADFAVNAGTMTLQTDGSADVFGPSASLAVNGTSTLNINENLTLDAAPLTRASGANIFIAAGKTVTLQNGADATLTGAFNLQTAATVTLTGSGTTLSATATSTVSDGGTINVLAGADLLLSTTSLNVGDGSAGTLTVDGGGSAAAVSQMAIGLVGGAGIATFSNGSLGSVSGSSTVGGGATAGTSGTLNIQSGAFFSTSTLTIGSAALPGSGTVAIAGGTLTQSGSLVVNGLLTRDATGAFGVPSGQTMTVQNGGDVQIAGAMNFNSDSTVTITGTGSTLTTTGGALSIQLDNIFNVLAGADVSAGGAFNVGNSGNGTVLVDGAGSTLSATTTSIWGLGGAATVTFSNGASASLSLVHLANTAAAGSSANVSILSGATVSTASLAMAGSAATGNSATLTIDGAGSGLTMLGGATLPLGSNVLAAPATLTVQNGGAFTSGTGAISVNASATVDVAGGTFSANGNMTISGGDFTKAAGATFNLASGRSFAVQNGGVASFDGTSFTTSSNALTVTGLGSQITGGAGTNFVMNGGSSLSVLAGGTLTTGGFIDVGTAVGASSVLVVDGAGSNVTTGSGVSFWGGNGGTGAVEFGNNATGNFGAVSLPRTTLPGSLGTLLIASGADVTMGNFTIAHSSNANTGTATITGPGSTLTLGGASTFTLGAGSASTATLTVNDGGAFTSGTGSVVLGATGTLNIGGGTATFAGPVTFGGGAVNFMSGALRFTNTGVNLTVGTGGLLGTSLTLATDRQLTIGGTTTIDAFRTLTLNGGSLSTGALVNNGGLAFNSGALAVTGAGGFTIGSGALGANVTLGIGSTLQVTNTATVASGAALTLNSGTFAAGALANTGTLRANLGTASLGAVTNSSGGRIFVGDTLSASGAWTNSAGSTLTLENSGLVLGAGAITNSGLVTGSGTIANPFTNASAGEVRGEFGKTLTFTGTNGANAGRVNLLGGTVQFAQQFTNSATGQINGQGALYFPTTPVPSLASPTAGLMNSGNINLSGGDSQIYGTVQLLAGSRLIVSGGATASFFDIFRHSGLDVKASAGSAIVFFNEVRGAGSFSGTGTIYFESNYSPGNSPAAVTLGADIVFGSANTLTLELGGLTAGSEYDQLILGASGSLALDGGLVLDLIDGFNPHFGDTFQLLDFDPGQVSGAFDEITIADTLPGGLSFDTTALSTTGQITVVPEPGVASLLLLGLALFGLRRRKAFGSGEILSAPEFRMREQRLARRCARPNSITP